MTWLGNSLFNLKDQITTLTREVLADADEDVDQPKFVPIEKFNRLLRICEEKEDQLCHLQQEVDSLRNVAGTFSFKTATNLDFGDANAPAPAATDFAKSDRSYQQGTARTEIEKNTIEEDALVPQSIESASSSNQNDVECNPEEKQVQNVLQRIENITGKNRLSQLQKILKEVKSRYEAERTKTKLSASVISFPSSKNSHGTDETMSNDSERSDDSLLNDFEILKPRSTSSKSLEEYSEGQKSDHTKCSAATQSEIELLGECKNTSEFEEIERTISVNLRCWEDVFAKINFTLKSDLSRSSSEETFWTDVNDLVQKNNEALKNYVYVLARENKSWKEFYQSLDQNEESYKKRIDRLLERELSLAETIRLKNSALAKRVSDLNAYCKKLENFNACLNEVSDEILDATVESNSLRSQLAEANEISDQLAKKNAKLLETVSNFREKSERVSSEVVEHETELGDRFRKVQNECEPSSRHLELPHLRELNSSSEETLHKGFCDREIKLQLEVDSLKDALRLAENEKVACQRELEEKESELSKNETFENECQTLRLSLEMARRELEECRVANQMRDQFCAREEEFKTEIGRLLESVRLLESQKVEYEKRSQRDVDAECEAELCRLRERYEILENESLVLCREREVLENQLREARETNKLLELELQQTRDGFCGREEEARMEVKRLQETLRTMEIEKNTCYDESRKEINSKIEAMATLESRERAFAKEIESLSSKFSTEIDSLTSKINVLDDRKNILKRNIEDILSRETENGGAKLRNIVECLAEQFSSSAEDRKLWQTVIQLVETLVSVNAEQSNAEAEDRARVIEELNSRLIQYDLENKCLRERVSELKNEFERSNEYSTGLKNNVTDLETRLASIMSEREQLIVSLKEKHNESLSYHSELQKVHALLVAAVDKNEEYDHQIRDLSKKQANNSSAVAEVERLRNHLLSMEESYTNDLLNSEQEIKELRSKLHEYEEHLKSINAAQTSVNVRTNQITESLQKEIKFLTEEKEKIGSVLKHCQTELQKSVHDAQNLRSALDLFHRNKDSEIFQATEKLRTDIELLQNENRALEETAHVLQNNLDVMKQKSNEQNELRNEIKCKEETIERLQSQVKSIQYELHRSEQKFAELQADTENKFKLNLLKNVTLRYIISNTESMKAQALQILADVLDFSADEKRKVGLSVFGECKAENDAAFSKNSLIDEFIRFVEKESNPKSNIPLEKKNNPPNALLSSTPSLPDVMLPTLSQFPANHNSRYILKDVLQ